jgi:putative transcriptional regulator
VGAVRAGFPVKSGTAVALNLRPDRGRLGPVATIPAIEALVKRHLPLLRAKRAIEAMLDDGAVFVELPLVEDVQQLAGELRAAGVVARPSIVRPATGGEADAVDVAALRQRLGMTQEQFARVFQIALPVVRNWEQGRNKPDGVATVMLRMIEAHPKEVEELLWGA